MDENEFYYEETNPKNIKLICMLILVILSIGFVILMYYRKTYTLNIKKEVIYEVGDKLEEDLNVYLNNKIIDESDYSLNLSKVTNKDGVLTNVGEFTYRVKYKSITKKGKIIVKDTTPPSVKTIDLKIGVSEDYELDEFLSECDDYSKPCLTTYKKESDANLNKKAGTYLIDIIISDQYENKVMKTVKLEVKKNYSRENIRKNDLKIHHIDPNFEDFNNELFVKYNMGVNEDTLDEDEKYNELLELASEDLASYLPLEYINNQIKETTIIFAYNKYNYIIGYSVRVTLDNGLSLYLSK